MTTDYEEQLCAGCGHARNKHGADEGCIVVLPRDRLGFVKETCGCPLFVDQVSI